MICYTANELIEVLKEQWVDQGQGDEPLMWEFVGRRHCERYAPNITKKQFRHIVEHIDDNWIRNEFHMGLMSSSVDLGIYKKTND